MFQELITLIIVLLALAYTIYSTVKLFVKKNRAEKEVCFGGCETCKAKDQLKFYLNK